MLIPDSSGKGRRIAHFLRTFISFFFSGSGSTIESSRIPYAPNTSLSFTTVTRYNCYEMATSCCGATDRVALLLPCQKQLQCNCYFFKHRFASIEFCANIIMYEYERNMECNTYKSSRVSVQLFICTERQTIWF